MLSAGDIYVHGFFPLKKRSILKKALIGEMKPGKQGKCGKYFNKNITLCLLHTGIVILSTGY
jgi:hypothetical protein